MFNVEIALAAEMQKGAGKFVAEGLKRHTPYLCTHIAMMMLNIEEALCSCGLCLTLSRLSSRYELMMIL